MRDGEWIVNLGGGAKVEQKVIFSGRQTVDGDSLAGDSLLAAIERKTSTVLDQGSGVGSRVERDVCVGAAVTGTLALCKDCYVVTIRRCVVYSRVNHGVGAKLASTVGVSRSGATGPILTASESDKDKADCTGCEEGGKERSHCKISLPSVNQSG